LEGNLAYDRIFAGMSKLKVGEKITSKVLRDGKVIELCATITP